MQLPWQVGPRLYLGSAVIADSHYLLAHLGVTHIVNATEVRQQQPSGAGMQEHNTSYTRSCTRSYTWQLSRLLNSGQMI